METGEGKRGKEREDTLLSDVAFMGQNGGQVLKAFVGTGTGERGEN
jgi:hypothetical protein